MLPGELSWDRVARMAIDPMWFMVAAYVAGALVIAVLVAKYFKK
jgi:hypothetical protein